MTRRVRLGAMAAAAALALSACSASGATTTPATPAPGTAGPATAGPATQAPASPVAASAAGQSCEVTTGAKGIAAQIRDFGFPSGLTVKAGESITWTNADGAPHTVTFDDGSCSSAIGGGATVTVTYTVAGTYPFHCEVHPRMKGTLVVGG